MSENLPKNIKVVSGFPPNPPVKTSDTYVSYEKIVFEELKINVFNPDDSSLPDPEDPNDTGWAPTNANNVLYFYPISKLNIQQPSFIDNETWKELIKTSSGFMSGNGTIMPKIVFPTKELTANGLESIVDENNPPNPNDPVDFEDKQVVNEELYNNVFNWKIPKPSSGDEFNKSVELKHYGKRFPDNEQHKYSFINTTGTLDRTTEKSKRFTRHYRLEDTNTGYYKLPSGTSETPTKYNFNYPLVGRGIGGGACVFVVSFLDNKSTNNKVLNNKGVMTLDMGSINIKISPDTDMTITINNVSVTGSVITIEGSQIPKQAQIKERKKENIIILVVYPVWNGIVVTSGAPSNKQVVDPGLLIEKDVDVDISEACVPKLYDFPEKNLNTGKSTPEPVVIDDDDKYFVDWQYYVQTAFENGIGMFSYMPSFFVPECRFVVYMKGVADSKDTEGTVNLSYTHYAYPVYCKNKSNYILTDIKGKEIKKTNKLQGIPVGEVLDNMRYYRFDFIMKIKKTSGLLGQGDDEPLKWSRTAMEIWGFVHEVVATGKKIQVDTDNGEFFINVSSDGKAYKYMGGASSKWLDYATSINVTINETGTTGNIVLDKLAMMKQDVLPPQSVGGLTLTSKFSSDNNHIVNGKPLASILHPDLLFTGVAMAIKNGVSESADTLDVSLYGFEKKLEDIKLINVPFWDGDSLKTVAKFLSVYGGLNIDNTFTYSEIYNGVPGGTPLPRSSDFAAPAVNFPLGTACVEAFRTIAEYTNHRFVIQKNGMGYFYAMNSVGIPKICYSDNPLSVTHEYSSTQIVSMDLDPFLDNIFNTYMTAGLLVEGNNVRRPLANQWLPGTKIDIGEPTNPEIPWSKIILIPEQGYVTREELNRLHEMNKQVGRSHVLTGNITIPGNAKINIYDNIKIDDVITLYIISITHTINCQTKEWTTGLSVAQVFSDTTAKS